MNAPWTPWGVEFSQTQGRNVCYKIGNVVFLALSLSARPATENGILTSMPVGFMPIYNVMFTGYCYLEGGQKKVVEGHLHTNGVVDILGMTQGSKITDIGLNIVYITK